MEDTKMKLADWLDDLCVRFIINLPQEELESVERICFQVEEAQWFYEDFIRPLDPTLPSLNLRQFCLLMFQHCPLLAPFPEHQHLAAFDEFLAYKIRVPVRGAIMLDENMEEVVLVKGWKKGANWSFPRGKINKDEDDLDCAIREVYEETGFNLGAAGLAHDRLKQKYIDVTMREQHMKLFVFRGVPKETMFLPRTRKEISKIQWYKLAKLPGYHKNKQNKHSNSEETISSSKLYMVAPFMQPLKKWIAEQRKAEAMLMPDVIQDSAAEEPLTDRGGTPENVKVKILTNDSLSTAHNLRSSLAQDQSLQPLAAYAQLSNENAAAQLKQFLSIGKPDQPSPAHSTNAAANVNANNLLAILRQGPRTNSLGIPQQYQDLPQTPMEQISLNPPEPESPRHRQPPPSSMANMGPPPRFPIISTQNIAPETYGQQSFFLNGANHGAYYNNVHAGLPPMQARVPHASGPGFVMADRSHPTPQHFHVSTEQAPRPYQRTGDPQFSLPQQASYIQGPSIPSASQLPTPNLSNHAQSLLDAFKSKQRSDMPVAPRGIQPERFDAFPSRDMKVPLGMNNEPTQGSSATAMPGHIESRSRQVLGQTPAEANALDVLSSPERMAPVATPTAGKPNKQREALLSLFRSPLAVASTTDVPTATSNALLPTAFELSAIPSPRPEGRELPHPQKQRTVQGNVSTGIYDERQPEQTTDPSAMPSPRLVHKIMKRPTVPKVEERVIASASSSPLPKHAQVPSPPISDPRTIAILQAASSLPDSGTVKRKHRAPRSPSTPSANVFDVPRESETGTGRHAPRGVRKAHARLEKQSQQPQPPIAIKILKRPTPDAVPSPNPEKPLELQKVIASTTRSNLSTPAPSSPVRTQSRSPKPPTPKPFQPKILRRPQSTASPAVDIATAIDIAAAVDVATAIDVAAAVDVAAALPADDKVGPSTPSTALASMPPIGTDRRQALLSLFAQSKFLSNETEVPAKTESKEVANENIVVPAPHLANATLPTPAPYTSTDHSKKLLSLFGAKPPPLPSTNMLPPTSFSPLSSKIANARSPVPPETSRSRINSIASAGGSGAQTPISPSDRGFLLSYLRGL